VYGSTVSDSAPKQKRLPVWVWLVFCVPMAVVGYLVLGPADTIPKLLCPNGEVVVDSGDYELADGKRGTTYETYCVEGAERRNINDAVAYVMVGVLGVAVVVPMVTLAIATRRRRS